MIALLVLAAHLMALLTWALRPAHPRLALAVGLTACLGLAAIGALAVMHPPIAYDEAVDRGPGGVLCG